jgi:hypothetical protein
MEHYLASLSYGTVVLVLVQSFLPSHVSLLFLPSDIITPAQPRDRVKGHARVVKRTQPREEKQAEEV